MWVQYIIDIGGKTINFFKVENGLVIDEESFSEELGIMYISSIIQTKLKRKGVKFTTPESFYQYLECGKNLEGGEAISELIVEHFKYFD